MKKFIALLMTGIVFIVPLELRPQFMTDYYPIGLPAVSNTVNLVTVTETFANNSGHSRSVNTIRERPFAVTSDVWVHSVDNFGNPTLSQRYGLADVEENAAAIVRCPNGDFIVAANTEADNIAAVWLFRIDLAGNVLWSYRYYNEAFKMRAFCIKKTNETLQENYVIAGVNSNNLMAFKISRNGNVLWHFSYTDPGSPLTGNVPKSMIVSGNNVIIAGNRQLGFAGTRDIFVIGVDQGTGIETVLYRYIDNGGRDDADPFINFARAGEYVITYSSNVNILNQFTPRVAFNRLTAGFGLALATTSIYWEGGSVNSYGHSIYLDNGFTNTRYIIGGGTTVSGRPNPIFFAIDGNGNYIANTYRRLWVDERQFISTYMMQDAFNGVNQYEHHNYFEDLSADPTRGSMSLLRDQSLPGPCNKFPGFNRSTITPTLVIQDYKQAPILDLKEYPVDVEKVHGDFKTCAGLSGTFKTASEAAGQPELTAVSGGFKVYPTLVTRGAAVNIRLNSKQDGDAVITVYNMQMQAVLRQTETARKGVNQFTLNGAERLAAGTFIVEVKSGGEVFKSKIVRQ